TVTVRPTKNTDENRYSRAEVEMVLGAAAADRLEEITKVAGRAIEKGCTVGRTLEAGMSDSLSIRSRDETAPSSDEAESAGEKADSAGEEAESAADAADGDEWPSTPPRPA